LDRSAVKAVVDRDIGGLLRDLGIGHWHIRIAYTPAQTSADGIDSKGECTRLVDYNSAAITLNPEAFDDEAEVVKTLRHELFHVVLSPFDVAWNAVKKALDEESVLFGVVQSVWTHATEKAAINLERMHHGLSGKAAVAAKVKATPKPRPKAKAK
jgi:hypothetical protein